LKLILRDESFNCLGKSLHFTISITIITDASIVRFTFKLDPEQFQQYGLEQRTDVFCDLQKNIRPAFTVVSSSKKLSEELNQCFTDYINNFPLEEHI
jgi:hypothetical protein